MCGIIGAAQNDGTLCEACFRKGLTALAHRGPDDSGLEALSQGRDSVLLGNTRLAILDLSAAGHQPMHDPEIGNRIVFNGEIYNFADVRRQLVAEGVQFRSHSDTEVVLKAYGRWGNACLQRLRGMFALAIWDAAHARLFLARDRLGEKPLYYSVRGGRLVFASEVRALLATGMVERKLSRAGLYQFLSFGSVHDPLTLLEGVFSLPPGHFASWENGRLHREAYWRIDSRADGARPEWSRKPAQQIVAELRPILEEAILLRTVSDVPIGVFLSGGIDSSLIAAVLATRQPQRISTFSVTFNEQEYSEAEYSRLIARRFATDHHEIVLTGQDLLESIPAALGAMDQPTIDGVNTFVVSRAVRQRGLKVALSGLGGDELFAGYSTFATVPRMERAARYVDAVPARWRRAGAKRFHRAAGKNVRTAKLASLLAGEVDHPYLLARAFLTPAQLRELLRFDLGEVEGEALAPMRASLERAHGFDPITRVSCLELENYTANTLLRDTDAMSMSQALEARVPLLDHRLVEFMMAVPGARKISPATPKHLLVAAGGDLLPPEIVHRPKRGFGLPFEHWLRQELRADVERVLTGSSALDNVMDPAAVAGVWRDFLDGRTSWSRPWGLFVLRKWVGQWVA